VPAASFVVYPVNLTSSMTLSTPATVELIVTAFCDLHQAPLVGSRRGMMFSDQTSAITIRPSPYRANEQINCIRAGELSLRRSSTPGTKTRALQAPTQSERLNPSAQLCGSRRSGGILKTHCVSLARHRVNKRWEEYT
jgi:hypothetical protein